MSKYFDIKFTLSTTILAGLGIALYSVAYRYDFGVASGCALMLGKGVISAVKIGKA